MNSQGHLKHGKSGKLLQLRGAQGNGTTKCNAVPWMGYWNRERTLGKN